MIVKQIKLARDRRKRKSYIKAGVFFLALLCIITGGILSLKDTVENNEPINITSTQEQAEFQHLKPTSTQSDENLNNEDSSSIVQTTSDQNEENATSYDDELLEKDDESDQIDLTQDKLPEDAQNVLDDLLDAVDQAKRITDQFSHTIVKGDKLKDVLEMSGLEDETSQKLIASYPELKNLKPGQQVYWILDNENELEYLNWLISEREERIYERKESGQFARQIIEKKSIWKKDVLKGQIENSLRASLQKLGLDNRQIHQLSTALQWQVNVAKLKKGDKFAVLVSREYLGDKLTGQGNVEAIHIVASGKSYYAIQANNGRYYNRQGETISKGFARIPLQRQARISSPFNPRRRHPVTGRVRPHKGTDFALPVGTPVIAPADAVVEKVAYQSGGAGRYVVLRHGREYQTVYMHLSKALVRAGQSVKRGERIALSGNTGISTGAHLHYEFHINGRPVNPMTVKLPGGNTGMADSERKTFLVRAKAVERQLKI
ncbi:murein DD-endopeptidase MepM [Pasteurellaceae bacterium 22721_9_1]